MPANAGVREGIWRLADPKISLASLASIALGAAAAARDGPVAWSWLALTVIGIFALEVAKNASGEVFDWDSGTDRRVADGDRSPFSGGKRVMVDGLLTRGQTWAVALAGYAAAVLVGAVVVLGREPRVLALCVAGLALAYFYHAPPLRLSYRGLGELAVALAYGPGICAGTYLVQRGTVTTGAALLGVPLGLLVAAFLWINEFPDFAADAASGKRTLVVRLGRVRASRLYALLVLAAFAALAALPAAGVPRGVWLGALAAVPAGLAVRLTLAHPETTRRIVPAQALTLLAFVALSLAGGLGLLLIGRG